MQAKYLVALKTRYADFGLSKEALDRVASQRIKTIANESEIEEDLAKPETLLLLMKEQQGAADVLRTNATNLKRQLDDLKKPKQEPVVEPNPYEQQFGEMQKAINDMMAKFEANEKKARNESVLASVHEKMKSMGCTNDYIRTATLTNVEIGDEDTADSIAEKYKSVYDANCKAAFGDGYVPQKGGTAGGDEIDFSAMVAGLQASGKLPK